MSTWPLPTAEQAAQARSDRSAADLGAQREHQRNRQALDAAEVGVWEQGLDGGPIYWSERMYRLRGLDPADPRHPKELAALGSAPQDRAALDRLLQRHLKFGEPYEHEYPVTWPDGTQRWLATRGQALRDGDGRAVGMAGVNFDISARARADALAQQALRLEQASRDRAQFMARMSHELRTPLNAVLGFAQLLAEDRHELPTPRQRQRLQRIRAAGDELLALIDHLLELADQDRAAPSVPAPAAPSPSHGPRLRIVCVEDNPVNLQLLREIFLLRPQIELHCASDGLGGVCLALQQRPDVLLLDLQLPDISGFEVARRLRAEPSMVHCRYVALSADAMPDTRQRVLREGFAEYWTKPIDFAVFLAAIDRLAQAHADGAGAGAALQP